MLRLLSIEYYKLKHNRASKIITLIYFGLLTSIALFVTAKIDLGPIEFNIAEQGIFEFPYIWHFNTYVAAGFKFFLLLVIVSMVANEYANKTLKQNLIDGLSKQEYVLSKFYMVVAMSLASTLFVFLVSLILGLIYASDVSVSLIFSDLQYFVAYFVKLISFYAFGLFLGVLIKRSAFAIAGMIVWYIIEVITTVVLSSNYSKSTADFMSSLLPLNSSEALITNPFLRMETLKSIATQMGTNLSVDYSVPFFNVFVSLCWTFLFTYGAYYIIKKRDL